MNKQEFLIELCARLSSLPEEDVRRSLDFYSEMIDDRMEDGLSEEEAVAAIGDPDALVRDIILTAAPVRAEKAPVPSRRLRWWEITLLVLGSPLWLSLAIAAAAVVFSLWVCLWCVVICLYAVAVALGASAAGCTAGCLFMLGDMPELLVTLGAALVCAGLAIGFFLLGNLAAKGMIQFTKKLLHSIGRLFRRKEQAV